MTRLYMAGPMFSRAELDYNEKLNDHLISKGFETFLPQKDGLGLNSLVSKGMKGSDASAAIFDLDLGEVRRCDVLVFIMDGRVPDEGACVELGIAFSMGKECVAIKTDVRTIIKDKDNPMILGCLKNRVAQDFGSLVSLIRDIESSRCHE